MPNWCLNRLTVTGPAVDIRRFNAQIRPMYFDWGGKSRTLEHDIEKCKDPLRKIRLISELKSWTTRQSDSKMLLSSFVAPPKKVVEDANYGDLMYRWAISHWGTKWDVNEFDYTRVNKNTITYDFSTAWSPPVLWVIALGPLFPTLTFELAYYEGGTWFAGTSKVKGDLHEDHDLPGDEVKEFAERQFGIEFDEEDNDTE